MLKTNNLHSSPLIQIFFLASSSVIFEFLISVISLEILSCFEICSFKSLSSLDVSALGSCEFEINILFSNLDDFSLLLTKSLFLFSNFNKSFLKEILSSINLLISSCKPFISLDFSFILL